MSLVVLDTDVASAVLRRRASDGLSAQLAGHVPAILVREIPLATFNVKDFADYEQHEGLELIRE